MRLHRRGRRLALLYGAALLLWSHAAAPAAAALDNYYIDWTYLGCFWDWGDPRSLPYYLGKGDYNSCKAQAEAGGFDTFGLQNWGECWACTGCDYARYGGSYDCSWLGRDYANQVHRFFKEPPPLPRNLSAGWAHLGCFKEGQPRMLPNHLGDSHTAETCQAAAAAGGYDIAALENGGQCCACPRVPAPSRVLWPLSSAAAVASLATFAASLLDP